MNYQGLAIQCRIYPDADDVPEGRAAWSIEPGGLVITARYYLLQNPTEAEELPPVLMVPRVINLQTALLLHGIEGDRPRAGHLYLFDSFTNEAQRDFPAIWRQQCRYIKALAAITARRYDSGASV